ncbi:MAG: hypothetical protein F4Y69_06175 [Chloroflexi bacterium]|nr:hypothetical protein [Chloroflexota bacterium]MCY3608133.1 hypothetical protein [Acidimicrobiaceae bacterium]MCY3587624.1 hypothetical protein [Chloroflexota bacterium]MDE2710085.1 hypothetical protein [Chloroflexota bacterium]MXX33073.1 hypothetical protein [Chloroflexota bacterium]
MTLTRTPYEVARIGDEIYERDIRALIEAEHHGEIVAIDVDSGSWGLGKNILEARERLDSALPEANDVFLVRVGEKVIHRFGGRSPRGQQ